jgi:hypothetical protein
VRLCLVLFGCSFVCVCVLHCRVLVDARHACGGAQEIRSKEGAQAVHVRQALNTAPPTPVPLSLSVSHLAVALRVRLVCTSASSLPPIAVSVAQVLSIFIARFSKLQQGTDWIDKLRTKREQFKRKTQKRTRRRKENQSGSNLG